MNLYNSLKISVNASEPSEHLPRQGEKMIEAA